jgi:hypothetical protein
VNEYISVLCFLAWHACAESKCENGGECLVDETLLATLAEKYKGYECYCKEGFYGERCEKIGMFVNLMKSDIIVLATCESTTCQNGGICQFDLYDTDDGTACLCTDDFYGDRCEKRYNSKQ